MTEILDGVSFFLGYGTDYTNATAGQKDRVDQCVKSGLRCFYWPISVTGRMHRWSFLKPTGTITLWPTTTGVCTGTTAITAGTGMAFYPLMAGYEMVDNTTPYASYTLITYNSVTSFTGDDITAVSGHKFTVTADGSYALPDDFGQIEGTFRFATGSGNAAPILVGEADIRQKRTLNDQTGTPVYVAVRPKSTTNATGQRFELLAYPTPDAVYAMTYRYSVLPNALVATTAEYPYGGAMHGETIRESCLAAAEAMMNDTQGIHKALFAERLAVSIAADLQASVPDRIGTAALRPSVSGATLGSGWTLTYDNSPV